VSAKASRFITLTCSSSEVADSIGLSCLAERG
jgi:hypothetical protein